MKEILILFLLALYPQLSLAQYNSSYDYSSYSATSINTNLTSQTISSTISGQSAVYINTSGITITDSTISKSGDYSSSTENSEFYGINAAILVQGGGLTMTGGTISNTAKGSNAIIATNEGKITINGTTITTTGESSARGLHATYEGSITAINVTISTQGDSCDTLSADKGDGIITCNNCTLSTNGAGSPLIYSTGVMYVENTTGIASKSQAVIIEEQKQSGSNIKNSNIKCSGNGSIKNDDCSILIHKSIPSDTDKGAGSFDCDNSIIEILSSSDVYTTAPFFYITNTVADISLNNCNVIFGSGVFMKIDEGGEVAITLYNQNIKGNFEVGSSSSLYLELVNSSIEGTINTNKTASNLEITLDNNSTITLTGNSYYTSLKNSDSNNSNIITGSYSFSTYDESSSSSSSTNVKTDDNIFSSSIISSTIINNITNDTSSNSDDSDISVILLGFSHFNLNNNANSFYFFIYFIRLLNSILSNTLTFPITVTHSALRFLQNSETIQTTCTLNGDNSGTKAQYNCSAKASSSIDKIQIDTSKFNFGGKTANLTGITPLANNYIKNMIMDFIYHE